MNSWIPIVRWIHILSAAAWFGEVVTIVFVLLPIILRTQIEEQVRLLKRIFPRLFRAASFLSFSTIVAGVTLNYLLTGWRRMDAYLTSPRGFSIILGGILGLLLTIFHFFVENRLDARLERLHTIPDHADLEPITRFLRLVPRIGLLVMLIIFLLMMFGARGL